MADHVCPPWVGYFLLNPLRKLVESPSKLFNPFVREGMVVLEPGCAMGFFTLPLARMVGPAGKRDAGEGVEQRERQAGEGPHGGVRHVQIALDVDQEEVEELPVDVVEDVQDEQRAQHESRVAGIGRSGDAFVGFLIHGPDG